MRDNGLEYDFIGEFSNGGLAAICGKSKKWGLINSSGEEVLPCVYDNVWCLPEFFTLEKNGKLGLANAQGKIILPCEYGDIVGDEGAGLEPLFRAKKGEKWGIANKRGEAPGGFCYSSASLVGCGGLFKVSKDGEFLLVDINGEAKLPASYYIDYFCDGFAAVQKGGSARSVIGGKWGYVNSRGELVIPCKYDEAEWFCEGLAKVKKDGRELFINRNDEVAFYCKFDETRDFCRGLAAARDGEKWGFIDKNGEAMIPFKFDEVGEVWYRGKFCRAKIGEKWGVIDKNGEAMIPFKFDEVGIPGKNGLTVVREGEKYAIAGKDGIAVPFEYDFLDECEDGVFIAQKDEKYGLISSTGDILAPLDFDDIDIFEDGLAKAEKDGKVGFLDVSGRVAIPFKYCRASAFKGGIASTQKEDKWYIVDKNGKTVAPR